VSPPIISSFPSPNPNHKKILFEILDFFNYANTKTLGDSNRPHPNRSVADLVAEPVPWLAGALE
jgi:hypothetical protein